MAAWPLLTWCAHVAGAGPDSASQAAFALLLGAALGWFAAPGRGRTAALSVGAACLPVLGLLLLRVKGPLALCGLPDVWRFLVSVGVCAAFALPALHALMARVAQTRRPARALVWVPAAFMVAAASGMFVAQHLLIPWLGAWHTMALGVVATVVGVLLPCLAGHGQAEQAAAGAKPSAWRPLIEPFMCALVFACVAALVMRFTSLQAPTTASTANLMTLWLMLGSAAGWLAAGFLARRAERAQAVAAGALLALALVAAAVATTAKPMAAFAGDVIASAGGSWPLTVVAIGVATAPWAIACGALGALATGSAACSACQASPSHGWAARVPLGMALAGLACGVGLAYRLILAWVGLGPGLLVAGGCALALGILRLCAYRPIPAKARGLVAAAAAVAFMCGPCLRPPSDAALVASAVSWPSAKALLASRDEPKPTHERVQVGASPKLLFHAVDRHGWLAVVQADGRTKQLVVDGIEASSTDTPHAMVSAMLALVPAALCSGRERALQLGLRDGGVLATLLSHGFRAVDCVEPRPRLLDATSWLGVEDKAPASNAALRLVGDTPARALATTSRQYDVIVSCPLAHWPWLAQASFTRAYLDSCRQRLTATGVCATWLPLRRIERSGLQAALRLFGEVFEHTSVWLAIDHVILAGSKSRVSLSIEPMATRLDTEAVRQRMKQSGTATAIELWSRLLMTTRDVEDFAGPGALPGWDRPHLELAAARAMQSETFTRNLLLMAQYRNALFTRVLGAGPPVVPEALRERHARTFDRVSIEIAHHAAIKGKADDDLFGELLMAGKAGPRIADRVASGPAAYKSNGITCFRMRFYMGAYRLLKKALLRDFRDAEVRYYLGASCRRLKKLDEAARHLAKALAIDPKLAKVHLEMAQVHLTAGKPQKAIDDVLAGLAVDQNLKGAHTLLGFTYGRIREYDKAVFHFRIALAKDPHDKVAAYNLRLLSPKGTGKAPRGQKPRAPGRTSPGRRRLPRQ